SAAVTHARRRRESWGGSARPRRMLFPALVLLAAAHPNPASAGPPPPATLDVDVTTTVPLEAAYYSAPLVPRVGVRLLDELTPGPLALSAGASVSAGQSLVVGAVPLDADWRSVAYFEDGAALDAVGGARWSMWDVGPFSLALYLLGTVGVDAAPIPVGFAISPDVGFEAGVRGDLDVGVATAGVLVGVESRYIFGRPEIVGEMDAFVVG